MQIMRAGFFKVRSNSKMKDFEFLLEKIISDSFYNREPYQKKSWWATDLNSCLRGAFYRRKGLLPTKLIPLERMGIMEVGKIVEGWIVDKVKQTGNLLFEQLRVESKDYETSGKVDLLIDEGGRPVVYEIKSINSYSFKFKKKSRQPQPQHRLQALFYVWQLRERGHPDLPQVDFSDTQGRIIYVSRDDVSRVIIPVEYSPKIVEEIKEQLRVLNWAWKNDQLPPVPEPVIWDEERSAWTVNWVCDYCAYHELCAGRDWRDKAVQEVKERNAVLSNRESGV